MARSGTSAGVLRHDSADLADLAGIVAAAAAGDRTATLRLQAEVQPAVLRYCRARLGNGAAAAEVARRVGTGFEATLPELMASGEHLRAFVHRIAVAAVDAALEGGAPPSGLPGMAGMLPLLPRAEREVLVLRVAVGLSADETATTLSCSTDVVRTLQHAALGRLRARS